MYEEQRIPNRHRSPRMILWRYGPIVALMFVFLARFSFAADERYEAQFADGSRFQAPALTGWHQNDAQARLGNRPLFPASNSVRWLRDRSLSVPDTPQAYIEFFGGDRLPGRVIGFRSGADDPFETTPAYLIVEPSVRVDAPEKTIDRPLRVSTRWLKRIAWSGKAYREFTPATVFQRDGRRLRFRALRWSGETVTLLREEGVEIVDLADVEEIHFPARKLWDAYFDQLAILTPDGTARLIQYETVDGLTVTTSAERHQLASRGNAALTTSWYRLVQPAWSLDPLWIRFPSIRTFRFFAAHQVPLTAVTPSRVAQKSLFGSSWRWKIDRNVRGGSLRSGGNAFGWGFGVQAQHELQFPLPQLAKTFRVRVGLDESVGDGGCARAVVAVAGEGGRTLYQSQILVGSKTVVDTGNLPIDWAAAKGLTLQLTADPVLEGRPQGADPFDIRDALDWIEPELTLDPVGLKAELARRSIGMFPGLSGWTFHAADSVGVTAGGGMRAVNYWDLTEVDDPRYRLLLSTNAKFVTLSQRLRVEKNQRFLSLAVGRHRIHTVKGRVRVLIEGIAVGEYDLPERLPGQPTEPLLIPVDRWGGKEVTVEVVCLPDAIPPGKTDAMQIDWRAVSLLTRRPSLLKIFEDDERFAGRLRIGEGVAMVTYEDAFIGDASVEVTPTNRGEARLGELAAAIRSKPRIGEFRYIRFAWKKQGGTQVGLEVAHDGEFGGNELEPANRFAVQRGRPRRSPRHWRFRPRRHDPIDLRGLQSGYRYDAGTGAPFGKSAMRLAAKVPSSWSTITRDLHSDFGTFTFTGLSFTCPDGDNAWFDHIYLARTVQDLQRLDRELALAKAPPRVESDPNILRRSMDRDKDSLVLAGVAPRFSVTANAADGLWLVKEHQGRKNVVRSMPPAQGKPCILTTAIDVPAKKKTTLELSVSHQDMGDWQLLVRANGQTLHDSLVSEKTTKDGWFDLQVDLSKFAGTKVLLEVHNHPNNWPLEEGYWSRLAVKSE